MARKTKVQSREQLDKEKLEATEGEVVGETKITDESEPTMLCIDGRPVISIPDLVTVVTSLIVKIVNNK